MIGVMNGDRVSLQLDPRDDGAVVAQLAGELDASCATLTKERLSEHLGAGKTLVIDLAGVSFMDSAGLGMLIGMLARARDAQARIEVANPSRQVHKLIETSGLTGLFALAGPSPASVPPDASTAAPACSDALQADDWEELRTLLVGYETLLRWGDLTPAQVTVALRGDDLADEMSDLALAGRVRAMLARLGEDPSPVPEDD